MRHVVRQINAITHPERQALRLDLGDFQNPSVRALIARHMAGMQASSPPEAVCALDLSGLQSADIDFFACWEGAELMAIGALRQMTPSQGEIKSMRTADQHLRKGSARAMLERLIGLATARGYKRLSLETGSGAAFEPALALYRRRGFQTGEAFGDYEASAFNQFLHLDL